LILTTEKHLETFSFKTKILLDKTINPKVRQNHFNAMNEYIPWH